MFDSRGIFLKSFVLLLLVVLVSCSDDDPATPAIPFSPTLESLWPHLDGNSWTYHLTTVEYEHSEPAFFDSLDEVPPIPSFEELYSRLESGIPCGQPENSNGLLNLFFEGEVAISPGDTVQRIRSIVEANEGWPTRPLGFSSGLWSMRADRIDKYPDWKNDDRISWVYLTDDLEPGAEFSFQLLPQYSDNQFLYGRIWRHLKHKLPNSTFVDCVESFYLYDGGIQQATDENGQTMGYTRFFIYGVVLYANSIGPIVVREQREGARMSDGQVPSGFRFTVDTLAYVADWSVQASSADSGNRVQLDGR